MLPINKERLIKQFIQLVQIDSESKEELAIATYLKEIFTSLGLTVLEDNAALKTGHQANNLICTLKGNNHTSETIFFAAHMDTVKPGNNIKPIIDKNFIKSDGTTILGADDKAAIAVIIELIHILKEQQIPHGDIQFILTVGEESGLVGAKAFDTSLIHPSYGYVLDSDGEVGSIVVQAPYQYKILTKIYGKAAHAGIAPEKGISAINVAAKAISKMKLGRIDEETTANIGYFKGGKQTNIVCDYVEILAEARSLKKEKVDSIVNHIKQTFDQYANKYGATSSIEVNEMYAGYHLQQSEQVVAIAFQAAEEIGLNPKAIKSGGGSDANIFNSYGIPTVNLAVGYENIHTKKERISIQQLINLTNLVLQIIKNSSK